MSQEYLVNRVRLELGDEPSPFDASFFADGISTQYQLDHFPIKEDSLAVTCEGQPFTDFEVDYRHGVMIFRIPPDAGKTFFVAGVRYKFFNDEDLGIFVQEAVNEHSLNTVDIYGINKTLDDLPKVQWHVIAIRATILALWALVTDASFDITISAPDGVNIPRGERFSQLMELLAAKQTEHDALAKALNVGVFRIEVYTLRRLARRTNRLVPLYMTQEYDDKRPPTRLFTEVSTQGNELPIEKVPTIDLTLRRGEMFVHDICINRNITLLMENGTLSAEVLRFPGQTVPRAKFALEVKDAATGSFRLSMSARISRAVPNNQSYWQLVVRGDRDTVGSSLLAQGKVMAERPVSPGSDVINETYQGG